MFVKWNSSSLRFLSSSLSPNNLPKLMHPALVPRINPFLKPVPAFVRNFKNFEPQSITLISTKVFNAPIRVDIMHRIVHWYRASLRAGTASTKHRSDVRGSIRKIHQQKGTGKARAGSSRAPHRRGGATCFGPKPRRYNYPLSSKLKDLGLRSAFSTKFNQGQLSFVSDESIIFPTHKTGEIAKALTSIPAPKVLLIDAGVIDKNLRSGSRTLGQTFTIMNALDDKINAYHVLRYSFILITERARQYYERYFDNLD